MKKNLLLFFALIITLKAQYYPLYDDEAYFGGGAGLTWIDNKPFYSFRIFPEFTYSNFGMGLDLNLHFDSSGKLRTENFNTASDYLSIIRYLRYGMKNDPLYVRLGALDNSTLGHGSIMYLYNNSPSFDNRKNGLEFDIDFNQFGFESVYSSFGEKGILGVRGYIRPFQYTQMNNIPVISRIEIGATYTVDFHSKSGVLKGYYNKNKNAFQAHTDEGNISIYGIDIGVPLLRNKLLDMDLYFDYNKIKEFGNGKALGSLFRFKGFNLVKVHLKFERRWNSSQYLPSYFNSLYELERFNIDEYTGEINTKVQKLTLARSENGYMGELVIDFINTFKILGSYQRTANVSNSGVLHLATKISPKGFPYMIRAGYDKININKEAEIFKLDEKSFLYAEFGYKPNQYLLVSVVYNWTFTPVRDVDDNIIKYEPQKKIEPRISLIYPFNLR